MAVILTKDQPKVSLAKHAEASGLLRVNLNWTTHASSHGLFKKKSAPIDLDLACLYEFNNGEKNVVQALGNRFEAKHDGHKVIWLDGDDRSGESTEGENMFVDLAHASEIKRVLVFAYIYEGTPNWAAANGVVTLYPQSGDQVEIYLDEAREGYPSCAVALLENEGGELVVKREVRYVDGKQAAIDEAYGWGLNWHSAHK